MKTERVPLNLHGPFAVVKSTRIQSVKVEFMDGTSKTWTDAKSITVRSEGVRLAYIKEDGE